MSFSALLVVLVLLIVVGVLWCRLDRLSLVVQALERKVAILKAGQVNQAQPTTDPFSQESNESQVVRAALPGCPQPLIEKKDELLFVAPLQAAPASSPEVASESSPVARGFGLLALMRQNLFATAGIGSMLLGFALLFDAIAWAMANALSQLDGHLFSPMGGALSLLAIGILFLVACYWAPLPPAKTTPPAQTPTRTARLTDSR